MGNKLYLYSIAFVAILGGFLFGYDTAVISGAEVALESFFSMATDFTYVKVIHGITVSSALLGCIIGSSISGFFGNKIGRKNSLILAAILLLLSALGSYHPEFLLFEYGKPSFNLLLAFNFYRILGGVGVGLTSAISPMYIAEISPANVRGRLVSCNQFAIIFGMLVVYFVNFLIRSRLATDVNYITIGWRKMFLSESIPATIFLTLLLFVPKTPRYLLLRGKTEAAKRVLVKINGETEAKNIYDNIIETLTEKKSKLFSFGVKVIVIGILLSVFQQAVGINVVLYYAPRIFETMGATQNASMLQTIIMGFVNIVFTLIAIFTVDKYGRKPLLLIGSCGMALGMISLSILSFADEIGILALISIIVYTASFMMSWGPICWVLISEIFPNTIRAKAVAIAVLAQWLSNFIVSSTFPSLTEWNIGKTYMIYAIFSILSLIFVWRYVPETKNKSLEDMNRIWKKR